MRSEMFVLKMKDIMWNWIESEIICSLGYDLPNNHNRGCAPSGLDL